MTANSSEAWCYEMLRRLRWPNGMICPRCGRERVTIHSKFSRTYRRRYLCLSCRRTFTDLTGTPFARTNLPLRVWFHGLDLVRNGVKTAKLARQLKVKWDTAAHIQRRIGASTDVRSLIHRLREAAEGNQDE